MLNGRFGDHEWTYISPLGKSVVDYICVPYEQMSGISGFAIHKMSDIIDEIQFHPDQYTGSLAIDL